jgi:hypothetical protein
MSARFSVWSVLVLTVVVLALVIDFGVARILLTNTHYVGDFTVFWTAPRMDPAQLYNPSAITEAQRGITGPGGGLRPFANPPSALPWLAPFASLPFGVALGAWVASSLAAYFAAARLMVKGWGLLLLAISPFVWVSAGTGQLSLLQGAAVIAAVAVLPRRPLIAGLLIGLAATLKPHTVILAPIALIAAREWRALGATMATGVSVGLACLVVQGPGLWLDWLAAARDFPELVRGEGLMASGVTPASLPVPDWARPGVMALGALLGIVCVWVAFAQGDDKATRLVALVAGSLLASPYGRKYDAAMLQPAVAILLLDRSRGIYGWIAGAAGLVAITKAHVVVGLAIAVLSPPFRRPMRSNESREARSNL